MSNFSVGNEDINEIPQEVIDIFRKNWVRLNEQQKNDILAGKAQLRVNCYYPKQKNLQKTENISGKLIDKKNQNYSDVDYMQLVQELEQLNSRKEGIEFLKSHFPTKKYLESFAKFLKVSPYKQNVQELRESIVSTKIGYRLTIKSIEKIRSVNVEDELGKNQDSDENTVNNIQMNIGIQILILYLCQILLSSRTQLNSLVERGNR